MTQLRMIQRRSVTSRKNAQTTEVASPREPTFFQRYSSEFTGRHRFYLYSKMKRGTCFIVSASRKRGLNTITIKKKQKFVREVNFFPLLFSRTARRSLLKNLDRHREPIRKAHFVRKVDFPQPSQRSASGVLLAVIVTCLT